jgi:ribose transport system substrate-binding protein
VSRSETTNRRLTSRGTRLATIVATALIGAVGVSACGSSGSDGASSTTKTAAATSDPGLAAAQKAATAGLAAPTKIPITAKITKPIPTGKKIAYISCGISACINHVATLKAAAADLGWTLSVLSTDGSPTQFQSAFTTALRQGADGILALGIPRSVISAQLAAAKAKGVPVGLGTVNDPPGGGLTFVVGNEEQTTALNRLVGDEVVASSDGKAHTVVLNLPTYPSVVAGTKVFSAEVKKTCEACKTSVMDIPITDIPKIPDLVVSYLRAHPDTNYVYLGVGDSMVPGLPAALKAAGLADKVKIVGLGSGGVLMNQYLAAGQVLAVAPLDTFSFDYAMMDALARTFVGEPIPDAGLVVSLLSKATVRSTKASVPVIADYREQFKQLWGK